MRAFDRDAARPIRHQPRGDEAGRAAAAEGGAPGAPSGSTMKPAGLLGCRQRLRDERLGATSAALIADTPNADAKVVVARHEAGAREVPVVAVFDGVARTGRLWCVIAPRAQRLICLRSSADRPRRTSRLLSCPRSVGGSPASGLTLKRTRMCATPRRTVKRPIMASARMISAQRDYQLVSCLLPASHLRDRAAALLLQADRGSVRQPMCCRASLALQEIAHSTSHARSHRMLFRVQPKQDVGEE
jgi:hypothetical protein